MLALIKNLISSKDIFNLGMELAKRVEPSDKSDLLKAYVDAGAPPNVARRIIAIIVTVVWALAALLELYLLMTNNPMHIIVGEWSTMYVMPPFSIVLGFYFYKRLKAKTVKVKRHGKSKR